MFNFSYREYLEKFGKAQKTLYLPISLDYWLRSVAEDEEISMNSLICGILEDYKKVITE